MKGLAAATRLELEANSIFEMASTKQVITDFFNKPGQVELISKLWITVDGKASADEKAQHTREYVSILNRQISPPAAVRRIFEMSSIHTRSGYPPVYLGWF